MDSTRKDILVRKQKGKAILSAWKEAMERLTSERIELESFLTLEETDRLRRDFFEKVRQCQSCGSSRNIDARNAIFSAAKAVSRLDKQAVVLFHKQDQFIGALVVTASCISDRLDLLWQFLSDDLCIASINLDSGLCLETNFYTIDGKYAPLAAAELTSWGRLACN